MPTYNYKAIDQKGKITESVTQAPDQSQLAILLKEQGLFLMEAKLSIVDYAEKNMKGGAPKPSREKIRQSIASYHAAASGELPNFQTKISLKELAVFTTQFSIMMKTALPILDALMTLANQQTNKKFKSVIKDIFKGVRNGETISSAFSKFPKIFDEVYISLLAAGEVGGTVPEMLERIVNHLNFQRELRSKTRSALVYPSIVVLTSIGVISFMIFVILPTFAQIFSQFNLELPWITKTLMSISDDLRESWYIYLSFIAVLWVYFYNWLTNPYRVKALHALQLKLPLIGTYVRNIVLTRILRTLGALVAAGVPILKSLELARASAANIVFSDMLGHVWRHTSQGKGMASAMAGNPYIPQMMINMIQTAEKTGTLPEVLNKIADHYEKETDAALKDLMTMMEPCLVIFLGLVVGLIATAALLPLYELGASVG